MGTSFRSALTLCFLGKYYSDLKEKSPNRLALDEDLAHELWTISEDWVGESFHVVPKE